MPTEVQLAMMKRFSHEIALFNFLQELAHEADPRFLGVGFGYDPNDRESERHYAHVSIRSLDATISVYEQIQDLPDDAILGILAHEFGHVAIEWGIIRLYKTHQDKYDAGDYDTIERAADAAAEKLFDFEIWYDENLVERAVLDGEAEEGWYRVRPAGVR